MPAQIDDLECKLEILDTAGQDSYQEMFDTWVNSSEGFLLVYSIDNKNSFESIKSKYEKIVELKGNDNLAIFLVGNKCDLKDQREVTKEEVENFCLTRNINCIETSALNNINIKESFLGVARELLKKRFPEKYNNNMTGHLDIRKRCYCF